jgi:hypothetical protein
MENCKPLSTPAEPTLLSKATEQDQPTNQPYSALVGALNYLYAKTRPDIAYATNKVCQFMTAPSTRHWRAAQRILRYLQSASSLGLKFKGSRTPPTLTGFVDADFAGDLDDRRSTTGYIFMFCGGPISWRSRKQRTVALSTTEAEYMAATDAVQEAIALRQLLEELQVRVDGPTQLAEDNQGAIHLINNNAYHSRTKHIDIKYHFIRNHTNNKTINFTYIPTNNMIADIFTKPLTKPLFNKHCTEIMSECASQ